MSTTMIGGLLAILSAFCYALSTVAIVKGARSESGRGNDVLLSIIVTAVLSGGLWLLIGPGLTEFDRPALVGACYFVFAGFLGNVVGRLTLFRSVELTGAIETGLIRRLIPVFAALLAFALLGEAINLVMVAAFILITSGVVITVAGQASSGDVLREITQNASSEKRTGRVMALTSAASYGGSFVSRKLAMKTLPDPLAGVFIGAMTGLVWFAISQLFPKHSSQRLRIALQWPGQWQILAAVTMSAGQVVQYFALQLTSVTVVALISSIEMFFAVWLAAYVLRTEEPPGGKFYLSALLAAIGVVLLAAFPAGS